MNGENTICWSWYPLERRPTYDSGCFGKLNEQGPRKTQSPSWVQDSHDFLHRVADYPFKDYVLSIGIWTDQRSMKFPTLFC
jgi:hypothetical protein